MRSTWTWARLIGAALAAALMFVLVPGLGAGPAGATGTPGAVPAVAGHRCPAGSAAAMAGGFLCATVVAPLDYRNPSGAKIKLAVVEHAATGPARRGVIFFNPAGRARRGRHNTVPGLDRVLSELAYRSAAPPQQPPDDCFRPRRQPLPALEPSPGQISTRAWVSLTSLLPAVLPHLGEPSSQHRWIKSYGMGRLAEGQEVSRRPMAKASSQSDQAM
jgi:hypothetical protein